MNWYVEKIEKNMSESDKKFLKEIYEPITVMHRPPSDAFNSMAITEDGEIRIYGLHNKKHGCPGCSDMTDGTPIYYASRDGGLSWKMYEYDFFGTMGRGIIDPKTGRTFRMQVKDGESFARISDEGLDSKNFRMIKLPVKVSNWVRPAIVLEHKDRVIIPGDVYADGKHNACVCYSDDNGETWDHSFIDEVAPLPTTPPSKGLRWQNRGCEPAIVELSDGTLMCTIRTCHDLDSVVFSYDNGTTWTKPRYSDFHAVNTTSGYLKMNDGRIVFFWNNTKPLPEQDMDAAFPPIGGWEKEGRLEDVFTNRDANCVAISEDDGKTWIGMRELCLNGCRNRADFRTCDGNRTSHDKSVQQCQMIELPYGKVLIHLGQNRLMSKVMIFDVNWLYEKSRKEDFRQGLDALSTQVYVKSISAEGRGQVGHCAWNRTNGALLVPNPDADYSEVLILRNTDDDRLRNNIQGAVWNFPGGKTGEVNVKLKVLGKGVRISVLDYWMNPSDETVKDFANFSFEITETDKNSWNDAIIKFLGDTASLYLNGELKDTKKMVGEAPNGLCYLHLQTLTENGDKEGTLIKEISAETK